VDDPRLAHPEAVLVNRGREVRAFFEPLLEFARYLPAVAFVPMVLLRCTLRVGYDVGCSEAR
jgi:ABC-type nitrate/sulfonate/bicarbonate transport system permease component